MGRADSSPFWSQALMLLKTYILRWGLIEARYMVKPSACFTLGLPFFQSPLEICIAGCLRKKREGSQGEPQVMTVEHTGWQRAGPGSPGQTPAVLSRKLALSPTTTQATVASRRQPSLLEEGQEPACRCDAIDTSSEEMCTFASRCGFSPVG